MVYGTLNVRRAPSEHFTESDLNSFSEQPYKGDCIISPNLQMKSLRHRGKMTRLRSRLTNKWQTRNSGSRFLTISHAAPSNKESIRSSRNNSNDYHMSSTHYGPRCCKCIYSSSGQLATERFIEASLLSPFYRRGNGGTATKMVSYRVYNTEYGIIASQE